MIRSTIPLTVAVVASIFLWGCLDETLSIDGVIAEPTIAVPIGKVDFKLKDFIEDDSIFTVSNDGLAQIIFREDSIASITTEEFLDNFTDLWNLEFSESDQIGVIDIDDIANTGFFALKAVVNEMSDPAIQAAFRANDGQNAPLPAFDEPVNFDIGVAPFANFRNIEVDSGTLTFSIENGFSFGLESVIFEIYDNLNGTLIHRFNKGTIAPLEKFDLSLDLAGKTLNNEIFIKMPRFKSPGSTTPVPIDLEQRMTVTVAMTGIKIGKGEVEVPALNLPVYSETVEVDVDNGVKITEANIKEGKLRYTVTSDVNVEIEVRVRIPGASKNGTPFSRRITLDNGAADGLFNLKDYKIDFSTDPMQAYNRLPVELIVISPGSGTDLVLFDKADEISIDFELTDLEVENFVGNAGTYTQSLEASEFDFDVDFDFLDPETKRLLFQNPKIKVFYENSFGVPIEAKINADALGHFGETESLNPPTFTMEHPLLPDAGTSVNGVYEINSSNSGISELLSIFPEKITYSGEINVNPDGTNDLDNFISYDSRLMVGVDLELPLVFSSENLVFRDTVSDSPITEENPEEVQNLVLVLDYKNGMPFTTTVDILGLDTEGNESTILEDIAIKSAGVDAAGRASSTTEERIEIELSREEIAAILEKEKIVLTVQLKTGTDGQTPVGVYTSDGIEIGLAARIQLKIEQ